jgi:copper oxidase (laccase) domain-containing protein
MGHLQIACSTKQDGHMSFGKIAASQTKQNINTFLNQKMPASSVAFMRIQYADTATYDKTIFIDKSLSLSNQVSDQNMFITDALLTDQYDLALLLPVADCHPFVIHDPVTHILALAHMGWHSTHADLLRKLLQQMQERHQSNLKNLEIIVGPGIAGKDYVHDDPVQRTMPEWSDFLTPVKDGYAIDVLGYNLRQLANIGITDAQITLPTTDTVSDKNLESHYHHKKMGLPVARRYLFAVKQVS